MAKKRFSVHKPKLGIEQALAFAEKKTEQKGSGLVPEGDVRLTANIRADLHMNLKMYAVKEKTTIGEILEKLIEQHIPGN